MTLVDDGAAAHLAVGTALPDVELTSSLGGTVNLAKLAGPAVVYVYPWTGRPGISDPPGWDDIAGAHGSTPETEGFRDRYREFEARGVEVYGLSTQDTEHQRELSARLGLEFALLSDRQFAVHRALSLPTFDAGGTPYLKRLTLLVRAGRIEHVFYPVDPPAAHAAEILDWLSAQKPA